MVAERPGRVITSSLGGCQSIEERDQAKRVVSSTQPSPVGDMLVGERIESGKFAAELNHTLSGALARQALRGSLPCVLDRARCRRCGSSSRLGLAPQPINLCSDSHTQPLNRLLDECGFGFLFEPGGTAVGTNRSGDCSSSVRPGLSCCLSFVDEPVEHGVVDLRAEESLQQLASHFRRRAEERRELPLWKDHRLDELLLCQTDDPGDFAANLVEPGGDGFAEIGGHGAG